MAFIAAPSDDDFRLELEILVELLRQKEYEAYIAVLNLDPGKFAFCTKICSKIIQSQFCISLLNPSPHRTNPDIKIPNPNVHLEYGLMLAFKKHVLPFQKEGETLAFNISPLDTIMYTGANFKDKADRAIDGAILAVGTTNRSTQSLASYEELVRYIQVHNLRLSDVNQPDAAGLYRFGSAMGFFLLDGQDIVYLGVFDKESPKEVVFRIKLLIQNLHNARTLFEEMKVPPASPEQKAHALEVMKRIKIEVVVSDDLDKERVTTRIKELTAGMSTTPWSLLTMDEIKAAVQREYDQIGEI